MTQAPPTVPHELDVLLPFWGMAGGVIKMLDYVNHAVTLGVDRVRLWAPPPPAPDAAILSVPAAQRVTSDPGVTIRALDQLQLDGDDTCVLFTEPTHHALIEDGSSGPLHHRLIHLVQGTRHANPHWNDGRNYRLLHRPMSRIMVSQQVAAATAPLVNTRFPTQTITEGHDLDYFGDGAPDRSGPRSCLRVLYTTWKSDLGDRVAGRLSDDPGVTFDAIRRECGWPELRRRYHEADIFLCTPGPEEGFYLPGLEAMAAGCAVVGALVGGNEAYMRNGQNALTARVDDVEEHVEAIAKLGDDQNLRTQLQHGATATLAAHRLDREARDFGAFLHMLHGLPSSPEVTCMADEE